MRKALLSLAGLLVAVSPAPAQIRIFHQVQPQRKVPQAYFSGDARVAELFSPADPSRLSAGIVTFSPGARSAWHTHPLGQVLIVTAGRGRIQLWGGPVQEIVAGDIVWIPPGLKHWHGAAPDSSMTHIALQENAAGKAVNWLEKTTEEQYHVSPTTSNLESVSPALASWTQNRLCGEVWNRPGLSRRDRSLVTLAALVARRQESELPDELDRALANGVKPSEISELIAHLAFYSGWPNALAAVEPTRAAFARAGVSPDALPPVNVTFLPLDEAAEEKRKTTVGSQFGATAPGLVQYTTDLLFRELWLRPGLAPRDRSLVTVSALIAAGQVAQVSFHLNRAMDNGLTEAEAAEAVTHLAFYVGWPNAMSALPVMKEIFEKRNHK